MRNLLILLTGISGLLSCHRYSYSSLSTYNNSVVYQIQPAMSGQRTLNLIVSGSGESCVQVKSPTGNYERCKKISTAQRDSLWSFIKDADFSEVKKRYQTGEDSNRKRIAIRLQGAEILNTEFSTGEPKPVRELEKQLNKILGEYEK